MTHAPVGWRVGPMTHAPVGWRAGPMLASLLLVAVGSARAERPAYPWLEQHDAKQALSARIKPPAGYQRIPAATGSFAAWLRALPLKPGTPPVMLHNGRRKPNQTAQVAVLDVDVGRRNLQQCADAVMRLRAEYLYAQGRERDIAFHFTSGDLARFTKWAQGYRPIVKKNRVTWARRAKPASGYRTFRQYLDKVFTYAGTYSLRKELSKVPPPDSPRDRARSESRGRGARPDPGAHPDPGGRGSKPPPRGATPTGTAAPLPAPIQPGDVFIQGGFPGHAVLVVDVAVNRTTGDRAFLLVQSYMPAQDIHLLRNPRDASLSPWYSARLGKTLTTPEWVFKPTDLRRFGK